MPIYEYSCKKCEETFEIFQKITEKPKSKCPQCRGKLEKLISRSAFHLKGAGWFKTTAPKDSDKTPKKSSQSSQPCALSSARTGETASDGDCPKKACGSS